MLLPQEPPGLCPLRPGLPRSKGLLLPAPALLAEGRSSARPRRAWPPAQLGGVPSARMVSRSGEHSRHVEYTLELASPTCLHTPFLESAALTRICSNCHRRQTHLSKFFQNISRCQERQIRCICPALRGGSPYPAPPHFSGAWLATSPKGPGNETTATFPCSSLGIQLFWSDLSSSYSPCQ